MRPIGIYEIQHSCKQVAWNTKTKGVKNKWCEFKLQVTVIFMLGEDGELEEEKNSFLNASKEHCWKLAASWRSISIYWKRQEIGLYSLQCFECDFSMI